MEKYQSTYLFLNFHVKVLQFLQIWRKEDTGTSRLASIKKYYFIILLSPTSVALVFDMVMIASEDDVDITMIIQSVLAFVCIIGEHYMVFCFMNNRKGIQTIVNNIQNFQKFSPLQDMIEADKKAIFYTKGLLFYSALGSLIYVSMPSLPVSVKICEDNKTKSMKEWGIPCGLIARVRYPMRFDYTPMYEIMFLHQVFLVFTLSGVIIMLTMLVCGVLIHATHHLKTLRTLLLQVFESNPEEIQEKVNFCVLYHIAIITYCEDINESFGSQLVIHLSLTSFVISILGFEIIMVPLADGIRFAFHLFGWLCLLLLVCYYGQTLINESVGVANDAYNTSWYTSSVVVQKDIKMIIMRAQKPITLNALNLGFMSLETFLGVMSTAYSYFTLLINIK